MAGNHHNAQPLRELHWLAHLLKERGREDIAQEILNRLSQLHFRKQRAHDEELPDGPDLDGRRH